MAKTKVKSVYTFGNKKAEGDASMKNLLGGKGANLAEMNLIGVPVPPGFTITTEMCTVYNKEGRDKVLKMIRSEVEDGIAYIEKHMGSKFTDSKNPCLVSVRSGSRASMPGMMDTILNLGLNDEAVKGLVKKTGNERFVWDSYRRFVQMYGDVVLGLKPASKEDHDPFEEIIDEMKVEKGVKLDNEFSPDDLKEMVARFKKAVKKVTGKDFPSDPWEQLWGAICSVFDSWMNDRAIYYRELNNIPEEWGTAVNVQAMVFGNMGTNSATGVAFTRDASTGEDLFNGEYLINAQGEDVVAGIRTPQQITIEGSKRWAKLAGVTEKDRKNNYPSLEETMPKIFKELMDIETKLEKHYKDMQDIEFTIQDGKLWMLQTRSGKRTGAAMVKMAVDMYDQKLLDEKTAILRVEPNKLDELLHPVFDKAAMKKAKVLAQGLPASPGAATGQIVFFADDAETWAKKGHKIVLVRVETSPEDLKGMVVAEGILTARGGMTSHAALVARGWGKCCIVGAGGLHVDVAKKTAKVGDSNIILKEGDVITLNGTKGNVYQGAVPLMDATENPRFQQFMKIVDSHRKMGVRANAETPADAKVAREYGAEGIGLFRTEHMFYGEGADQPLFLLRKMILSSGVDERRVALNELFPYVKKDIKATMAAMDGLPVTFRLLDPPLHEFVPQSAEKQAELAKALGIKPEDVAKRGEALHESNPMMGHRGVRLGVTYPEVSEMQIRAIFESAVELINEGKKPHPEIMVPVTCDVSELDFTKKIADRVYAEVCAKFGVKSIVYKYGTMIEIPRAALLSDQMAKSAEFFSFGTNDLTQMTFGFSRDDIGGFMNAYLDNKMLAADPFQTIDQAGVGQLIQYSVERGRKTRPDLKVGICGEQGGDPASVEFCYKNGLTYVSCSPYRVPIARLAAAQATIKHSK